MEQATQLARQLDVAQRITHIGSWEWDVESGAVLWSDELYRIYGIEPRSTTITLEWFLGRVHPSDRERIHGEVTAALERGGRFAYRERIIRPDGSVRELDTVGEVLEGRKRVIGTCRDVTEERRLEETIRLYADLVSHLQTGLSVWRFDAPGDVASLRLVAANPAAGLAASMGKTLLAVFPEAAGGPLPALLLEVRAGAPVRELPGLRLGARTFAAKAFALPDESVGLALEDVTMQARWAQLRAGEQRALEMVAAGAPLAGILEAIVRLIEELSPGTLASVLLLDETGTRLRHGAAPSLPAEYNRRVDGEAIGPSAGSCGTAAWRREAVYVSDVRTDPLWTSYRDLPLGDLRACWSTPIVATEGRVLGTFALYQREPGLPDETERALIARAVHVTAIAIGRRQLDDRQRALSERIEAEREDERTGIARELHDQLGQALTAQKMDLAWLERRLGAAGAVGEKLLEMKRAADQIIDSVRRISAELRPGILDDLGLAAAIEWQAEEFERRTGIRCTVCSQIGLLRLDRALGTAAFRIFQEALTNVARHAGATRVDVRLGAAEGKLTLEVRDDGVGLPLAPRGGSLGLLGMRERARRLGGDCRVQRGEAGGTVVSLTLPLPPA